MVCCELGCAKRRSEGVKFSLCPQGTDRLVVISSKLFFSVIFKIGAVDKARNSEGLCMGSVSDLSDHHQKVLSSSKNPRWSSSSGLDAADGASGLRCQS